MRPLALEKIREDLILQSRKLVFFKNFECDWRSYIGIKRRSSKSERLSWYIKVVSQLFSINHNCSNFFLCLYLYIHKGIKKQMSRSFD